MATVGNLVAYLNADVSNYEQNMGRMIGFSKIAVAAIGAALVGVTSYAVKAAAELEQTQIAFEVMTGSAELAKQTIEDFIDMGAKTPYESKDLLQNAKLMMLYGASVEEAKDRLKMLGDVAGGDKQKLHQLTYAFSQISATGRLMGQDLLQMVNAGFNPLQIMSEKTGKSMRELKKDMENGAISADMVVDAFRSATSEGGRFYQMMEKQSQTVTGLWATIMDNVNMIATSAGKKISETFKINDLMKGTIGILSQVTESLNSANLSESEQLGKLNQEYQTLSSKTKLTKEEKERFYEISNKISELSPQVIQGYDEEGNAIINLNEALRVQLQLKKQELMLRGKDLQKQSSSLERRLQKEQKALERAQWSQNIILEKMKQQKEQGVPDVMMFGESATKLGREIRDRVAKINEYTAELGKLKDELQFIDDLENGIVRAKPSNVQNIKIKKPISDEMAEAIKEYEKGIKAIQNEAIVFGDSSNLIQDSIQFTEESIRNLISKGFDPNSEAIKRLVVDLNKLKDAQDAAFMYEAQQEALAENANLMADWMLAIEETTKEWDNWSNHLKDIASDTAQEMSNSMSNLFFDMINGEMKDLGDYVDNFLKSIMRSFSNAMAQMFTQKIMMSFGMNVSGYANGGNFGPGPMVVGEKGPELLWSKSSGSVTSNKDLQKSIGSSGEVTIKEINIINNTGSEIGSSETNIQFDPEGYIIGVVLNGVANNKGGLGDLMKGAK